MGQIDAKQVKNLPSGSGGALYEVTIGASGADYTTLKAAVDDGKTRILAIDDTTESANIAVPSAGLVIGILDGVDIDMQGNKFTYAAAANVVIQGYGSAQITGTNGTSTQRLFENQSFNTSMLRIDGVQFDFTASTQAGIFSDGIQQISNCRFLFDNSADGGYQIFMDDDLGANVNPWFRNNMLVGGGSSCNDVFHCQQGQVTDIIFEGTFDTANHVASFENDAMVNGITTFVGSNDIIFRVGSIVFVNIRSEDDDIQLNLTLMDSFEACFIENCFLGSFSSIFNIGDYAIFNNIVVNDFELDPTFPPDFVKISNCEIDNSINMEGSGIEFSNNQLNGTLSVIGSGNVITNNVITTISVTNDQNTIIGNHLTNSITLSVAADNNTVVGNVVDTAVTDSGTGNQVANNAVY